MTESENTKPRYSVGEQVTVSRGKLTGKVGTVLEVDETKKEYAVRIEDFGLRVVSFSAVKPKTEPALTAGQLAEAYRRADTGDLAPVSDVFLAALEALVPGITAEVAREA